MKLLGAILAGGASRRFGSDKADALLDGRKLVDHVAEALRRDCDALVICGRIHPDIPRLEDRPAAGLGPLGGLCAALEHGREAGFEAVLSAPCDVPNLPADLFLRLAQGGLSAYVAEHPVIGLWPCALVADLHSRLEQEADRSMRAWVRAAKAAPVSFGSSICNINTRDDLAALQSGARP
ncbi:molybdenum cofactor guanylyltransferase [Sphingomonas psychrotolerans]|uniref:Molybdenum cofactor guanylyltransferase n=1 Tax=Sphingomonas psychrotolerans TaxID=1327635 RepID=A0A2K8MD53_9SPHN|nr:molybdenum cofactor guanylyltransferase [Sphingomonas psychrotolerans]ATY30884.1 molybdenum cofactor guanylyltransferase [Sphingomonas psychrotolerans]